MSKTIRELKETVRINRHDDEAKKIAQHVGEIIRDVFACYDRAGERDLCGNIQVGIRCPEGYSYYTVYFRSGGANHGVLCGEVFYPSKDKKLRTIIITVGLSDMKNHLGRDKLVCKEVKNRLTKEILGSLRGENAENATIKTLKAYIKSMSGCFSAEEIYEEAESIGITDFGLVDKVLSMLIEERRVERLERDGEIEFKPVY